MTEVAGTPGLLLDRDGVLLVNRDPYLLSEADIGFLPGVLEALAQLRSAALKIAIVTNQSAVGRGLLTLEQADSINDQVVRMITRAGGRVDGVFVCPHHPDDGCACRKPRPGLILQAAERLGIDLRRSYLIGDTWNDIRAAQGAGVARAILVRTGFGGAQAESPPPEEFLNLLAVCRDLPEAIDRFGLRPGRDGIP